MKFKSLAAMLDHFSNELVCAQYIEQQRWNGTPICPHCGSEHHYRTKTRFKHPELQDYKDFFCKACRKKYTVLTGTAYESSKIRLRLWVCAVYLLTSRKRGMSSTQLARDLDIPQKTAWYMLHRIRQTLTEKSPAMLDGITEIDESFVGGKNKNRHYNKKIKGTQGRSFKDKTPIVGFYNDGLVRCEVVADTDSKHLHPIVLKHVAVNSMIVTDEWRPYVYLGRNYYYHEVVDHSSGQYLNDSGFTTNRIEGFWNHLKRAIIGTYNWCKPKYLQRYCNEITFRFNHRGLTDAERFEVAIQNVNDTRLGYKMLTG